MVNSPRQNVSEQLNLCVVPHNLFINKSIGVSNRGRSFWNFNSPHDVTDSRSGGVMSVIQVNVSFTPKWSILKNNCIGLRTYWCCFFLIIKLFFNKQNIRIIRDKIFVLDYNKITQITRFIKNVTNVLMITTSTYGSFSKLSYL